MSAGDTMLQRIREITAQNNAASAAAANAQMQFQAEMSNTAHQREVEDLIKAGLNPVLSANYGASTPNGAMAQTDMTGASAYSGYMGALANAGAIMYSADRQYETQRDFPNTWAGLLSRLVDDLGLRGVVREISGDLGLSEKKFWSSTGKGMKNLIIDAARYCGLVNGNKVMGLSLNPANILRALSSGGTSVMISAFTKYLRNNMYRYFSNFSKPREAGSTWTSIR